MTITCGACGSPVADNAYVCHGCGAKLRRDLSRASWLADELDITLSRQGPRTFGSPSRETPLVFHMGASDAASHLKGVLVAWTRFIADERGTDRPAETVVAVSGFLLTHVEWLRHHQSGPDALDQVKRATAKAWRVIDLPDSPQLIGVCGAPTESGPCPYDVYAPQDATSAACRACGAVHDDVQARRLAMLAGAENSLLFAAEIPSAVAAYGVPQPEFATVRTWVARGRLTAHGVIDGKKVYRLGDALDLVFGEQARKGKTA